MEPLLFLAMGSLVLYSTNVFLKFHIQRRYRKDIHYVWCSAEWDSQSLDRYAPNALVPPSSNPVDIYRMLRRDVDRKDRHSAKITEQKASFALLAKSWLDAQELSQSDFDDLLFMIQNSEMEHWRPLIYVIPRATVADRLVTVPLARRAGLGDEYIIKDLKRDEFEIMEL
jgi:hypothetical protein